MAHHRSRSRGIATVLIMLLIGMSLTAMVLSVGRYIRSTQSQTLSTHAQTQAQMKAWTGAEIVQQYLQALLGEKKLDTLLAMTMPVELTLGGSGVDNLVQASITSVDQTAKTVTVEISGLTAAGTRAQAESVLQVIYGFDGSSSSGGSTAICATTPRASTVFKGDVNISGGQTSMISRNGYADIAVEGSLTISNASEAIISGCTKGDISLSGGGIDENAYLYSENGKITIQSMSTPRNATLWARDISIGNTGSGSYVQVRAGSYAAAVLSGTTVVGTAKVGGQLLAASAGKTLPWTTGTVIPWPTGTVLISTTDGSEYLLDLSKAAIDTATGVVSGVLDASEKLQGQGTLPDTLSFRSQSISGGNVDLYTLNIQDLWGHAIDIQGWSGTYNTVRSNGHFKVVTGSIGSFTGGGDFWAVSGGCSSPSNCWNFPTITSGRTAGAIYYSAGKTALGASMSNLTAGRTETSPGLPGVPFCDTRTDRIDVDIYRSQANYVFEIINGNPQLTIQSVKRNADGKVLDGTYSLKTPSTAQRAILEELMICDYGNNKGCLQNGSSWSLGGVQRMPPGVAWFDRSLTVNGTQVDLLNTIVSKGSVTLTTSGHKDLYAPNFSTPAKVCDGSVRPTNLCTTSNNVSQFASWTDAEGQSHQGLPLANMAVLAQENMSSQGWTLYGNVSLGGGFSSGANATQIYGAITVGTNQTSHTSITQGGMRVNTSRLTQSQSYVPGSQCTSQSTPSVRIRWSRYL